MSNNKAYYDEVFTKPWGKMFYDLLFPQLLENLPSSGKVLDFGSGFGKTVHFLHENGFDVTAYEPDEEKLSYLSNQPYKQITGNFEQFKTQISGQKFDIILIHNVLEYVAERNEILNFLLSNLTENGILSIVKHIKNGQIMRWATNFDQPKIAREILQNKPFNSINHGEIKVYDNQELIANENLKLLKHYGIRAFYALSQNNGIKETDEWYDEMLQLEKETAEISAFRDIAMLNHLIFQKKEKI